jgi:hypothetical protein
MKQAESPGRRTGRTVSPAAIGGCVNRPGQVGGPGAQAGGHVVEIMDRRNAGLSYKVIFGSD